MNHKTFRILQFIIDFKIDHNGNSPTLEEIRQGIGISSKSVIHHHMLALEEAGIISREVVDGTGRRHAARISVKGIVVYWNGPDDLLELP